MIYETKKGDFRPEDHVFNFATGRSYGGSDASVYRVVLPSAVVGGGDGNFVVCGEPSGCDFFAEFTPGNNLSLLGEQCKSTGITLLSVLTSLFDCACASYVHWAESLYG